jgi:DNA-binding GntR family transcriptional regulator
MAGRPPARLCSSDAWESDVEGQGHDPIRQDLQVEQIAPPPPIAQRLNLDPEHDVCVVRRHIRYIDDRPAIISDDFFDDILKEAGYEQVYDVDEIITRMPTPEESNAWRSRRARRLPSTSGPATPALARRCG